MALFDKLLKKQTDGPLTVQEAVASVLFVTVCADGEISDTEQQMLIGTSNRMRLLREQTAEQFNSMMGKVHAVFKAHSFEGTLAKAVAVIPENLKPTVFALAADMAYADGQVDENEELLMDALQTALGVDDDLALKIIEVLQIKNAG